MGTVSHKDNMKLSLPLDLAVFAFHKPSEMVSLLPSKQEAAFLPVWEWLHYIIQITKLHFHCIVSIFSDFPVGIGANPKAFEWEVKGISSLQIFHIKKILLGAQGTIGNSSL